MGKDGGSKPPASQRTAKDGESTSSSARSAPTPSSASSLKAHSGKSLRPLSSFLGVSLGGVSQKQHRDHSTSKKSSSSKSTSNAFVDEDGFRIPAPERQKTSSSSSSSSKTASRSFQRANTSGHTIELSSDEDDNVVVGDDDVQLVEIDDDDDEIPARADSDDEELVLTGFKQGPPSASTSQPAAPKLVTSAKRKGDQQAASPSPSKETAKGRGAHESAKALGKQKAKEEERNYVELEVMDHRTGALWAEKYSPVDLDSLCVNKRKVEPVRNWLEEAWKGGGVSKYRRILILSGPTGSAKTATIRVLSREMNFEIVEYKSTDGYSDSLTNQFSAFLSKASHASSLKFGTLTADDKIAISPTAKALETQAQAPSKSDITSFASTSNHASGSTTPARRKLILVEDLPNIFTAPSTKTAFRNALIALATSKRITSPAPNANIPVVIIISEALLKPGANEGENAANRYQGSGQENISVRNIVPTDVLRSPVCAEIKFNGVATTFMKKALNAILDREYANFPAKRPSPRALELVIEASNKDIRSALNTLQFVVGDSEPGGAAATLPDSTKKGKKRKSSGKVKAGAEDVGAHKALMHLVATKESSLFLFHALGKVLFNKRWGEDADEDAKSTVPRPPKPEKLPPHLKEYERRASKVDPNALFADAPVDSDTFMTYVHQNYPPFCNEINECADLVEYLSSSDSLLRMEGDTFTRHALTSHYSFQVSVRGALLSLPSPVIRRGQKMFKSEIWDVLRRSRENSDLIGDWTTRVGRANSAMMDSSPENAGDLLPKKALWQLEMLPFIGLMQDPQKSFSSVAMSGSASRLHASPGAARSHVSPSCWLDKKLLEVAFFPKIVTGANEALNENDVVEEQEEERVIAPAVKVENEETVYSAEEDLPVAKLYLSDDDIDEF